MVAKGVVTWAQFVTCRDSGQTGPWIPTEALATERELKLILCEVYQKRARGRIITVTDRKWMAWNPGSANQPTFEVTSFPMAIPRGIWREHPKSLGSHQHRVRTTECRGWSVVTPIFGQCSYSPDSFAPRPIRFLDLPLKTHSFKPPGHRSRSRGTHSQQARRLGRRCMIIMMHPACLGRSFADANIFMTVTSIVATLNIAKARDSNGKEITP
ncbi:uncharacterized protein C8Q71DRAFT_725178 [Rhodofomes roseus]|uniref:Uncharacterized protein n=1 Tax=Rhodofomes roseus TaxID=34475 RepID=A0ABQ8KB67_9APHY|nr:uncharacterized protein C8Q71DRAFT_725178 [Rhodofomes roseus]KAH9834649.1 hypothetical protein C8Q71DRAFT_725178 [Rhodofomes roseus]